MQIVVLNGSPKGDNSITLHTMLYIQKHFPDHDYQILHVGQKIRAFEEKPEEWAGVLQKADLLVFCYPVYTFLVPSQLHRFIELIKESRVDLSGKYATQVSTSKHFYDVTAHRFIQDICNDFGMKYIRGLSADMEDLLHKKGQRDTVSFFHYVLWNISNGYHEPVLAPRKEYAPHVAESDVDPMECGMNPDKRIVIVADFSNPEDQHLKDMCHRLKNRIPCRAEIIDIQKFTFSGGCLGCFHCAADGACIYRDGFDRFLRDNIQTADGIVYAFSLKDHSMGSRFKTFDDRQFCNGHRTVTMGKPVGYLVNGDLENEANLHLLMEARAQVGGNTLSGIATNRVDPDMEIDRLAASICYDIMEGYIPPRNFYGVGGLKIFRDLIWQMQGLMKEDHKFYKKHGFYDFPQKKRGTIFAMYLVGFLMNNEKLRKKLGNKITEGMVGPYKKILDREV